MHVVAISWKITDYRNIKSTILRQRLSVSMHMTVFLIQWSWVIIRFHCKSTPGRGFRYTPGRGKMFRTVTLLVGERCSRNVWVLREDLWRLNHPTQTETDLGGHFGSHCLLWLSLYLVPGCSKCMIWEWYTAQLRVTQPSKVNGSLPVISKWQ